MFVLFSTQQLQLPHRLSGPCLVRLELVEQLPSLGLLADFPQHLHGRAQALIHLALARAQLPFALRQPSLQRPLSLAQKRLVDGLDEQLPSRRALELLSLGPAPLALVHLCSHRLGLQSLDLLLRALQLLPNARLARRLLGCELQLR